MRQAFARVRREILVGERQTTDDRIRPLMISLGYTEGVESDHEYNWQKGSTHIELHDRLIPSYNRDYYAYSGEGWQLAKTVSNASLEHKMSAEDEMIYLFTHFAKYCRDSGISEYLIS